ncbi:triphosphoribosyl-dephospho-CoA synthase [Pelovirga terrestris]|uniref:triphosphoribosyl-dephospho-CoA synthase n=1 Tax=Pelovirga terrestris TaxID=2771352 RepID=A0A8J6ULE9_9BACT|nr:triphosphoribosyl-dephospho-CoA synthase [Pelovirga terrestris]
MTTSRLETLATALANGLRAELYLTPKPGLVDLRDNGAHPDLNLLLMCRSIRLVDGYLQELAGALLRNAGPDELIAIGRQAEHTMIKQLGSNTHRGGIFLCGLILVAADQANPDDPQALQQSVIQIAAAFFAKREEQSSNGEQVRRQHPAAGIVTEALAGLPNLFDTILPILNDPRTLEEPRRVYLALARLMQKVQDSTSLHRCGEQGLTLLRQAGARLEECILGGHDPTHLLTQTNREFRRHNLTMGGVADLLGVGLGYAGYLLSNLTYHQGYEEISPERKKAGI